MENLSSALPVLYSSSNLSAEEFQSFLSSWLEEKGIIADIRSQLRFKLIHILRNTIIGKNTIDKFSQQNSLSKHAINLIVGEFLIQNRCHYSLSVFNTEASLSNIFPECSPVIDNTDKPVVFRFDSGNILNILELIGVPKTSIFCTDLLNLYFTNNDNNSILSCLVKLLSNLTNKYEKTSSTSKYMDLSNETNLIQYIGGILIQNNYSVDELRNIIESIKSYQHIEINAMEMKHNEIVEQLKHNLNLTKNRLKEAQKLKKDTEHKLNKMSTNYKVLKTHVKYIFNNKLLKENVIPIHVTEVTEKLNNSKEELCIDSNCTLPHCDKICKKNIAIANRLKKENLDLKVNKEKLSEDIKKIILKYNNLLKDFVDCQNKICLLNRKVNKRNLKDISSPLCREIETRIHTGIIGESTNIECLFNKFSENCENSEQSSVSVTEQILKETKLKLQILQEESQEIEEHYKSLQYGIDQIKL